MFTPGVAVGISAQVMPRSSRRAEQVLGIVESECEPEQRRHGPQRDVALVPGEAHAEHFLALPEALADHAEVGDRGGVRAGLGVGEREAGDLEAFGEAGQVVVLLLFGAEVQQQLGRPERIRHHHRHGERVASRGELGHHLGVRERREAEAAVLLRDDHAEEALVLEELPELRRQVVALVRDFPVVGHGAGLLDRAVDECLLLRREARRGRGEQPLPVRAPREQIRVPPDGAGVDGLALGLRHVRQDAPVDREHGVADQAPAQRRQVEHGGHRGEHGEERRVRARGEPERGDPGRAHHAHGGRPDEDRRAKEREQQEDDKRAQRKDEHGELPSVGRLRRLSSR
jgi:hypothetical protein